MREKIPFHPLADLFPIHDGEPLWKMSDDIKVRGLDHPIIMLDGKVLDGRRRYLACLRAGVKPTFKDYKGKDALGFVISTNLHRRHLSESERAFVAAKIATLKLGDNQHSKGGSANLQTLSRAEAAEKLNVSERSVAAAAKVIEEGTPKLQEAVSDGTLSVSDAAAVAKEPPHTQNGAVAAVRAGKTTTARAAVQKKAKPAPKPPKPGKPTFDDRKVEDLIGKLVRAFDERGGVKGKTPEYHDCVSRLDATLMAWRRWQVKTS